jgi:hypothetical protein
MCQIDASLTYSIGRLWGQPVHKFVVPSSTLSFYKSEEFHEMLKPGCYSTLKIQGSRILQMYA